MNKLPTLLQGLDKVREHRPGRWMACCPAHDDRSPSLSIRELDDGRVLVHCFSGCDAGEVMAAVGMSLADLYPDAPGHYSGLPDWKRKRLEDAEGRERLIVEIYRADIHAGRTIERADSDRAKLAAARVRKIQEVLRG